MRNQLQLNSFEYSLGAQVYGKGLSTGSEMGLFFDRHPENYEMLVMEFNEYLVDVSVNEQTVHWCGHSRHQLQQPYLKYEQQLLELNRAYCLSLLPTCSASDLRRQLAQIDLEYLSVLQIKNRTLKQMVAVANSDLQLEGEHQLAFDFDEADRKLQFFNTKALILAAVDEHERPFYSIPPLCSPDKLIDMLDTNDSSCNSEGENFEYLSESQGEGKGKERELQQQVRTNSKDHFEEEEEEVVVVLKKPASIALKKVFAEDLDS